MPKQKRKYIVHGYPEGFDVIVEEYTWAYSGLQAIRNVRLRLQSRHGLVYLSMRDCAVTEIQT